MKSLRKHSFRNFDNYLIFVQLQESTTSKDHPSPEKISKAGYWVRSELYSESMGMPSGSEIVIKIEAKSLNVFKLWLLLDNFQFYTHFWKYVQEQKPIRS